MSVRRREKKRKRAAAVRSGGSAGNSARVPLCQMEPEQLFGEYASCPVCGAEVRTYQDLADGCYYDGCPVCNRDEDYLWFEDEEFLTVAEFRELADELFRRFGMEFPADSDSFRWRLDDTPFCPVLTGINYDTQEIRLHGPEPAVEYARQIMSEVFGVVPSSVTRL